MWFKNIHIFRLVEPITLSMTALEEKLAEDSSRPCGQLERSTYGWVPPSGIEEGSLIYAIKDAFMISAKKEEKLLPTSVVRDHVKEEIGGIEKEQARKVGAREKRDIFDQMTIRLLPQAFSKSSRISAYIDTANNWLIIDTASMNKAEELISLLRNSLGSLKIAPLKFNAGIRQVLTNWVGGRDLPAGFNLEEECELQDPGTARNIIKCLNQALETDEVQAHLRTGKQVTKLALTWQDRLTFVIDEEATIKRIRFLDLIENEIADQHIETAEDQFDADFSILANEFASLLPALFDAFGGLATAVAMEEDLVVA